MALAYPLTAPALDARAITFRAQSINGLSRSPFTGAQQGYAWQGSWLEADIDLPPMKRADAEEWIGLLLALNGTEGSLLVTLDPANLTARGTWSAGTPLLVGAHVAGVRSLAVDGLGAAATFKAGDWLQLGATASSRLHKVVQSGVADGTGAGTLEIFPRTRAAYADNAALDIASPQGLFMLAGNVSSWSIGLAQHYGLSFSLVEDLRGI